MNKKITNFLTTIFIAVFLFVFSINTQATFSLSVTLDPNCLPTASGCDVYLPATLMLTAI